MTQQNLDLKSFESRLRQRLLETQDPSTGGWAEHPGGRLSALNTAEAVMGLAAAGIEAGDASIKKAVGFLFKEKASPNPPDSGAWPRKVNDGEQGHTRSVPDIVRTSIVVSALITGGQGIGEPVVRGAVDWIVSQQINADDDHGWGYRRHSNSKILPTCFALLTLMRTSNSKENNLWKEEIERGLNQLTEKFRNSDGSFGTGLLRAAHTIYSCLVLQSARSCGFSIRANAEKTAIEWLLRNQDPAIAPIEEIIEIDPNPGGGASYPFMFTMEALLLRVLSNSEMPAHRETDLWLEVQRALNTNFDEATGGFFGQRVFSWSTAGGLFAIKEAERHLTTFPSRPPEYPTGLKVGNAIVFVAIVLVCAVVYLSALGKFSTLQASVFGLLVLACLLAYGSIKEVTFRQLASHLLTGKAGLSQNDSGVQ